MTPSPLIAGSAQLIEALGYWPSFHDAEVISFSAERAFPFKSGETSARLKVNVRTYKTVGEGTVDYRQALEKNLLVNFLFTGACALEISDFNHQNVIDSITVSSADTQVPIRVAIESIFGFGGVLFCSTVAIESVEVLAHEV